MAHETFPFNFNTLKLIHVSEVVGVGKVLPQGYLKPCGTFGVIAMTRVLLAYGAQELGIINCE